MLQIKGKIWIRVEQNYSKKPYFGGEEKFENVVQRR